jgi:hypothetical protein
MARADKGARSVVVAVVSLMGVALGTAGCGGGSGPGSGPIPLSELPARAVDVICNAELACQAYPDSASCHAALHANLNQVQADVAAGKVKYDASQAGACLDSASTILTCRLSAARERQSSACAATFVGTVAEGGPCLVSEDCVSAHCNITNCAAAMCCAGTCVAAQPTGVAVGGACTSTNQCVDGAFCDFGAMASGTCAAVRPAGQPCTSSDQCVSGTACLPTSTAAASPRACTKPPGRGEPCMGIATCDDRGDFCDPTTMKCAARLGPGSACDPLAVPCVLYATCDMTTSKCVARGGVGAPCGAPPAASSCLSGLSCMNGTCAAPTPKPVCPQP